MSFSWVLADIATTAVALWTIGVLVRPFHPRTASALQVAVILAGFVLLILGLHVGLHNRD